MTDKDTRYDEGTALAMGYCSEWRDKALPMPAPYEIIAPYSTVAAQNEPPEGTDIINFKWWLRKDLIVDYNEFKYKVIRTCPCHNKVWLRWPD